MIRYFNIPAEGVIHTPISKKLFAEKAPLSAIEKRILREDIESITMRGLLQSRTVGLETYSDEEYLYDQIIIAEVVLKKRTKVASIVAMIQRAFPVPMFLLLSSEGEFGINWCVKRINQADKSKRVLENQRVTRFFTVDGSDDIVQSWLQSLDVSKIKCATLKELFEGLSQRLLMLEVSDEAGTYIEYNQHTIEKHRILLTQLATNREEQKVTSVALKSETQFNARLKLTAKLKQLQIEEKEVKDKLR